MWSVSLFPGFGLKSDFQFYLGRVYPLFVGEGGGGGGEVRSEHVSHLLSSARSIKVFLESTRPQSLQPAASPQLVVVLVVVVLAPHEHQDYVI